MLQSKKIDWKNIFYTLLVVFFCIADQQRGSATGSVQFVFVNMTGVGICLLMLSTYQWKDFRKRSYLLWTIFFLIVSVFLTYLKRESILYPGQWYTALLNIWLMGFSGMGLVEKYVVERKRLCVSLKTLLPFTLFMLLACFSRNDSLWQWWYFVLFGMLYFTEFSVSEKRKLSRALLNGIIIGFIIIQGLAFMFRPYDVLRYNGMYANPNMNALFYSLVYCAFLGKFCGVFAQESSISFRKTRLIFFLAGCGFMWSFVCFTMCRTAMISMALVTAVAGLYCLCKIRTHVIQNALKMACGLLVCIIIGAPVTYSAVRYLPPLFHHPIWFEGEYSEERVHSWDPIDSPKYIRWEQVWKGLLGRMSDEDLKQAAWEITTDSPVYVASLKPTRIFSALVIQQTPLLTEGEAESSVNIRTSIYRYYLKQLNLAGHANAENGVQVTSLYNAPHAHNMFLQMAFSFGIVAGIAFIVWIATNIFRSLRESFSMGRDTDMLLVLLFLINITAFGMLEITWLVGQLSFLLLFLLPLFFSDKEAAHIGDVSYKS